MARSSPTIRKYADIQEKIIQVPDTLASIAPLSADANSFEGINVYAALIDEGHVHKDSTVYNGLKAGTIARQEPLILYITTAGFNLDGPCYKEYRLLCDLLDGKVEDPAMFGVVYEADENDDWADETTWIKANPSMGHSVTVERMREEYKQAINEGGQKIVNFKTKHLNIWCQAEAVWIQDEIVQCCMEAWADDVVQGHECYGGLDLASTRDLTAFSLVWDVNGRQYSRSWYWLPEDVAKEIAANNDRHPYINWVRSGLIMTTPGNATDYQFIRKHINELASKYKVHSVAYDRWGSSQIAQNLVDDGMEMVPFGQGFVSMSEPTKSLERDIYAGDITMFEDHCLRWQFGNVVLTTDPAGNVKPNKAKAQNKIDGVVSLIMAKGNLMRARIEGSSRMPDDYTITSF